MNLKLTVRSRISGLYRVNNFKMGYKPTTYVVKNEKGDLFTTSTVFG
jgi:hypothetical protein